MASQGFRLRVTYRKVGRLRFLSHLEVARAVERCCRRAGLPYAVSQGFNPRMRIAFGPALPVGTAGERERFDVWLTGYVPATEALERLAAVSSAELRPVDARFASNDEPSLSAGELLAEYEAIVEEVEPGTLEAALDAQVRRGELAVEHKGRSKVFDLTRSLPKEPSVTVGEDGRARVRMTVRIGPEGSVRPEMLIDAALSSADATGAVVHVTRTGIANDT